MEINKSYPQNGVVDVLHESKRYAYHEKLIVRNISRESVILV